MDQEFRDRVTFTLMMLVVTTLTIAVIFLGIDAALRQSREKYCGEASTPKPALRVATLPYLRAIP